MEKVFDMDTYEVATPITAEFVLNQIDDVLILRHYIGEFQLGKAMKSPLRVDNNPSFKIVLSPTWLKLMYKDWTTGESGDCFKLVARMHNITWVEAIYKVAYDFGLIKGIPTVNKKQLSDARKFKEEFQQKEFIVQFDPRKMQPEELAYWADYCITEKDLKLNNIYSIRTLWVNKKQFFLNSSLHFAYYFPEVDKLKIYSPKEKEWKWFGNVSAFEMEGVNKLLPSVHEPLIITKSRKDRIILSKIYPNVCSTQNEAETAIPKEMDAKFDLMYPSGKFCWFDSDEAGKSANRKLNHRGYKWINIPNDLYEKHGVKDPSDVIKFFGWEEGSKILKKEISKKLKYG